MAQLAHHVFFTLHDASNDKVEQLITACKHYLDEHDGVVSFAVGRRTPDLQRDVNDLQFHVSLHVVFASRADHDEYQTHPRHLAFIAQQKANWSQVRVFDSDLA